jgi:hypothetical protein
MLIFNHVRQESFSLCLCITLLAADLNDLSLYCSWGVHSGRSFLEIPFHQLGFCVRFPRSLNTYIFMYV